jgi:integrase
MATVVTYNGGLRRIEFSLTPNGPRKTVRLGRVSAKVADGWKSKIEAIVADKALQRAHDAEVAAWLAKLDESMLARMRAADLADGVGLSQTTLSAFLERYFGALTGKPSTRTFYGHTRRNLEEHFGKSKVVREIGAAEADGWRAWLIEHEKLSAATVARRVIAARTFWRKAVRWKLASENPFEDVKAGHQANDARKVFVPHSVIDKIMAEAPDAEWRAIIALSRYGGLRCPSEHYALRWRDIDWERGAIRVTVPKLAHIEHCAFRTVPLFPELRDVLLELFDATPEGAEYVISRHRLGAMNLRQQFTRIIAQAGAKPWPRLFHNLRASRESELMRDYDLATVCKWIGNSPAVAARHYATSIDLDADFRRAAGFAEQAQQNAQRKAQLQADSSESDAMTSTGVEREKGLKSRAKSNCDQPYAIQDNNVRWALQDSNL